MGAADLDNVFELIRFRGQRAVQLFQTRQQHIARHHADGDMHRGGEGVVRGLAHVHMVIGMDRLFRSHHPAQHFDGAVRDHLIGVHVGLGTRSGLPDHQREVVVKLALDHLLGRRRDGLAQIRIQITLRHVDQRAGLLDDPQRADDGDGLTLPADGEVDDRPLGLRAPVFVGGNLQRAKAVGFGAGCGGIGRHRWQASLQLLQAS